jgi:hypothetical protein
LCDRSLYVEINGIRSQLHEVTKGVPQGSALGPVLFSLYINDIINALSCSMTLFADDMELHVASKNISNTVEQLNNELIKLSDYMKTNRLELNVKKTVCMFPYLDDRMLTVKYNGITLNIVSEFKYLGIWFDKYFTWKSHFSHLISRVKQRMYIMYRSRQYCRFKWRRLLFVAFVQPYFIYGIEVWYTTSLTHRDKLELLHRRCLRIILNDTCMPPSLSRYMVYCDADIWPLFLEFQLRAGALLYSTIQIHSVPGYFDFFPFVSSRSVCLTTRSTDDTTRLDTLRITHERTRAAFRWWGCKLWNSIPPHIRSSNSRTKFIRAYILYLNTKFSADFNQHRQFHDFL